MKKHTHKTRLARLDKQQTEVETHDQGQAVPRRPAMGSADYKMDRWLNALSPEDWELWFSQYRPSQRPLAKKPVSAPHPKQTESIPRNNNPQTAKRQRKSQSQLSSREAKLKEKQRLWQENYHKDQRHMHHLDMRFARSLIDLPAEDLDKILNGWKKDIRPYSGPL